jgi:hypothetical protein
MKQQSLAFSHIRALAEKDSPRKATGRRTGSKHFPIALKKRAMDEENVSPEPCTPDHSRPCRTCREAQKNDHKATAVVVALSMVNGAVIKKEGVLSRAGTTLYRAARICGNRHAEIS